MSRWTIIAFIFASNLYGALLFSTDDAPTVETGNHELEIEYGFEKIDEGIISVCFAHGLTKKMDFGIGLGYLMGSDSVFLTPEFSVKYNLFPEFISASLSSSFRESSYSVNGIITRNFGDFELDGNFGYSVGDSTITYGIASIYDIEKFHVGVEILGNKDGFENWLLGVRYWFLEGLALSLGASKEFNSEAVEGKFGAHYEF
jgi:hypothetical protein